MSPASGAVGTVINITGANLAEAGFYNANIGDTALSLYQLTNESAAFIVPADAQSGDITLEYRSQTIIAGHFEVTAQAKTLLAQQAVVPVNEVQTVTTGDITVLLPPNAIDTAQTLQIERIENPVHANLPDVSIGAAFSVTLGDVTEFNDVLVIEYILPVNLPGEPSAAYFDEDDCTWRSIYCKVNNGILYIQTDHLTDFIVKYSQKAIYSPDGYFKIYYRDDDYQTYASDMDELARKVGQTLEEVRKDYEVLPTAYRENYSFLGFKDAMDVYLSSSYTSAAQYMQVTNDIKLPTTYRSAEDFETTLAHELFHAYQDAVWNEVAGAMSPYRSANNWIIEATAELASFELAFPEKSRQRELSYYAMPRKSMNVYNGEQEYDMSCFISWLLKETNSTFVEMWSYIAPKGGNLEIALADFFKSKSSDFLSLEMSYTDFWRAVITDANAPLHSNLENTFNGGKRYFNATDHYFEFFYNSAASPAAAYGVFAVSAFSENMPVRTFNLECTGDSGTSAMYLEVTGVEKLNELNALRVPGGEIWGHMYPDASAGETHKLITFKTGSHNMTLVGLENFTPGATYRVSASEIQAQCTIQKLEDIRTGKEIEFTFAFKDIYSYVTDVEVVIDFGDGTTLSKNAALDANTLSGHVTHKFGQLTGTQTTASLYDVSGGSKVLICQYVIPIVAGENVKIGIMPNYVFTEETVYYSTNIEGMGYTYQWNFGDGTSITNSAINTEHAYTAAGTYTVSVMVMDETGSEYGTAHDTVTVEEPEASPEVTVTQSAEPTAETENTPDPALVGTWQYIGDVEYLNYEEGTESYFTITLHLYDDWTFSATDAAVPVGPNAVASSNTTTGTYDYRYLYATSGATSTLEWHGGTTLIMDSFELEKIS